MCSKNFLTVETQSGLMDVFIASPELPGKYPVVLVFQEAFGVNSHIRDICERLAREGFLAAAPELYHRAGRRIEITYVNRKEFMPLIEALTNEEIIQDAQDTILFLKNLPQADHSQISSLGFCVGGFASVLCALNLKFSRAVSFYGAGMVNPRAGFSLRPIVNELSRMHSQCLFFFGGSDASIPHTDITIIEKKLTEGEVPFEVTIFPDSDHGFFCDQRKSYNQRDSSVAWIKTLKFLRESF